MCFGLCACVISCFGVYVSACDIEEPSWTFQNRMGIYVTFSEASGTIEMNKFMRGIYAGEVFLHVSTARKLSASLRYFVRAYSFLAFKAFRAGNPSFPMFPKLHGVHEVAHAMSKQCEYSQWIWNPATVSCSMGEDFVGRCASISRGVSPRLIAKWFLQRYLCHIQVLWARA